ncbi:MAG TPA: cytochrome c biogenesis CcdA family protein [Acidimicrobiales bacterium]
MTGVVAALGPDGPLAVYLASGMVATVNPCGFALLPAYLSYFLGLPSAATGDDQPTASVWQAFRVGAAVSAGFLVVFAVAGLAVELTSLPVYENVPWISLVIGVALLVLGLAMLAGFEPLVRLPKLDRGGRTRTVGSMFVFGVSYAVASIGCTLPTFLVAVSGTIDRESIADGLMVFGLYALGMTVVLLALTVAIALARTSLVRFLRQARPYVGRVAGGLVALAGAYVVYYGWEELQTYREPGQVPDSNITRTVAGWSYDVQGWISDIGPVRIAATLTVGLATLAGLLAVFNRRDRARATGDGAGADVAASDARAQGASRSTRQPVGSEASGR